jgi:hypothetical protein
VIKLGEIIKELDITRGSYDFDWQSFIDFIPNSVADFYMNTVMDIHSEIRVGDLKTPTQLKSRVDEFVDKMTSKSKGFREIGDNKFVLKYEYGNDLTFVIYDFAILYDKNTFSRSSEPERVAVVGWIFGKGGTSEFGLHPKKIFQLNRVFRVHGSYVDKKQRGKGFGKILYDSFMNDVEALVSDKALYSGSFGIWTKYILNKSKFFGVVYEFSNSSIVVPVKKGEVIEAKSVSNFNEDGFVAITRKIPPFLQKMTNELKDVKFNSIDLIDATDIKFGTQLQDLFDEATSMDDLFSKGDEPPYNPLSDYLPSTWNDAQSPTALIYFQNALVLAKEGDDSINWDLM